MLKMATKKEENQCIENFFRSSRCVTKGKPGAIGNNPEFKRVYDTLKSKFLEVLMRKRRIVL